VESRLKFVLTIETVLIGLRLRFRSRLNTPRFGLFVSI